MSELTINNGSNNSYLEQAAILLLCLGEEAAATVMQKLSREEVVRLSENMANHLFAGEFLHHRRIAFHAARDPQ